MQIKITVDIENTDILKFFELFKKDLATVAKNTTVETVAEPLKNESADFSEEQPQKKAQKKQPKNDCTDFSGVQETEEKSDNTADNNSLETDLSFSVFTIESKVNLVKSMLVDLANCGRKAEAKEILTKNKVPALSKLCDASEKTLIKIYNEVKNANAQ